MASELIARLEPGVIHGSDGGVVFDIDGDLHPCAHRPLRRGPGRRRGRHRRADHRSGALHGARGLRERLRRHGDAAARHVLRRLRPGARRRGLVGHGARPAWIDGPVGLLAPTVDITRTGQSETVDGVEIVFQMTPGTESPAEMNFSFPGHRALCLRRERHPQPAQPAHRCAARRSATRGSGRGTSPRRSNCSSTTPMSRSPPITGRRGARDAIATYLSEQRDLSPTCTTRPCGCSTRVSPAPRSPRSSRCRRRWTPVAHPWLLRLGQPQRQGDLPALPGLVRRQPRPPLATPTARAAQRYARLVGGSTSWPPRLGSSSTKATSGSPPSWPATPSSPTRLRRRQAASSPTRSPGSDTARSRRPGGTAS